ncbi:unnamed protein product [Litomosoides sigmodontis]|uniref:Uncharacterized protein n=1 Tax=Litomosoides sigmodontis TaxID=42156 RepID=A0A3P6SW37_LITSI|nr:unnamed protein product [Litomosoides sigmodontis]
MLSLALCGQGATVPDQRCYGQNAKEGLIFTPVPNKPVQAKLGEWRELEVVGLSAGEAQHCPDVNLRQRAVILLLNCGS